MDPRDRVLDSLDGRMPDVPPVAVLTQSSTVGMMESCGASWPSAHSDADSMARLGSAQAVMFGFESVRVPFDITAEAERLGCTVDHGTVDSPPSISLRLMEADPLDGGLPGTEILMTGEELISGGRPRVVLDALGLCSKEIGQTHPVCGGLLGPVTLLSQLMGAEGMVLSSILEPDWMAGWCSALVGIVSAYAKAQTEAGADVITIVEAAASPDLIDPDTYDRMSCRHMDAISGCGARTVLHICGDTGPILGRISGCGTDAFLPDPSMDPDIVVSSLSGRMTAVGSVDPVGTLLFGGPSDVIGSARRYYDS